MFVLLRDLIAFFTIENTNLECINDAMSTPKEITDAEIISQWNEIPPNPRLVE